MESQNEEYEGTYANQAGRTVRYGEASGNMHGNPDKNLRPDIMRRIRRENPNPRRPSAADCLLRNYTAISVPRTKL